MKRRISMLLGVTLVLTACAGGEPGESDAPSDCAAFSEYGTFDGATVDLMSGILDVEADMLEESLAGFEECTGIDVEHYSMGDFETQLTVQIEGGNAPDVAIFPQPALLREMVEGGHVVPAPEAVEELVNEGWTEDWKGYGTVDGMFYAAPLLASVKSYVWYSPAAFEEGGYEVPTTLDEMRTLTERIAADNAGDAAVRPWCAGIESGGGTGWPLTDWVEDMVLRTAGPDVYDQWVSHEMPFNDPQIVAAIDAVGEYLRTPEFVNGGFGDVRSIAATSFLEGGLPILDGTCYLHRQASFYEAQFPEGTTVAPDGDVYAFAMPGTDEAAVPLVVGGDLVGALNDEKATVALQRYLASSEWAAARVELGGVSSANLGVDPELASSDILRLSMELLQEEEASVRFDGSDLMPQSVGAGTFWTVMTQWIDEGTTSQAAADVIEAAWVALEE